LDIQSTILQSLSITTLSDLIPSIYALSSIVVFVLPILLASKFGQIAKTTTKTIVTGAVLKAGADAFDEVKEQVKKALSGGGGSNSSSGGGGNTSSSGGGGNTSSSKSGKA
jgi:uncharacterized membrane protein YgcG